MSVLKATSFGRVSPGFCTPPPQMDSVLHTPLESREEVIDSVRLLVREQSLQYFGSSQNLGRRPHTSYSAKHRYPAVRAGF